MEAPNNAVSETSRLSSAEELLKLAKFSISELKPVCQELIYGEYRDDIKLLELDNTLLNELQHNPRLIIRGDTNDNAFLCTLDKTYELKQAVTSNSLLIVPDLLLPAQIADGDAENESITIRPTKVFSAIHDYVEVRPVRPRLRRLNELLQQHFFSIDASHAASAGKADDKITLSRLLNCIQASEAEIVAYLDKIEAFVIDGSWTLLDFDYTTTVLEHILDLMDENSWSTGDAIPLDEVVNTLESIHRSEVLRHVCRVFGKFDQDETHFRLNESRVCRHYGVLILRSAGRMNLSEFSECWQQSVPKPMITDMEQLQGFFLIEETNVAKLIEYFSLDQLSENVDERIALLFKKKAKWTMNEIKSYIEDLAEDATSLNALLSKHSRSYVENGQRYFCLKK